MKKIIITCCAALGMFGFTSCGDDFLSVEPSSSMSIDEYYDSESRIYEGLVAAYDPLQWFDYCDGWAPLNFVWDAMTDDVYVGGADENDQFEIHLLSKFKSVPLSTLSGAWGVAYSGVNRSNNVIERIQPIEMNATTKALFVAEATVLRAWYYSVLWKFWGNVPYYDTNLTFPYIADQYTAKEVYEFMEADLAAVLDSKVLPMKQTADKAGRVTQAMASMLYAECVMYQQDESKYAKALGYMKDIINSGEYELQPFENLWETEFEWNKETIFDINYIAKGGKRGWNDNGPRNAGGTVLPAMIGIDKLTGSPDYEGGWGFEPVTPSAYAMYDEKDIRRDIGILNIEKYIAEKAAQNIVVTYGGRYQNTGFFLRKYLGRIGENSGSSGDADLNWDNNLRYYRYAETLLNAAELAVRTGADGQTWLNEVRSRAGLDPVSATLDNILHERHLEFVGEGKRYFDLVRFGKATEVLVPNQYGRIQWTENKKYLPIPQGEIDAALGALKQNPY